MVQLATGSLTTPRLLPAATGALVFSAAEAAARRAKGEACILVRTETSPEDVVGMAASEQEAIDHKMCQLDGTPDKSRLGANAILGVSLACAHAAANARRQPLWKYLDRHGRASAQ